jgi:hypothetical protein
MGPEAAAATTLTFFAQTCSLDFHLTGGTYYFLEVNLGDAALRRSRTACLADIG